MIIYRVMQHGPYYNSSTNAAHLLFPKCDFKNKFDEHCTSLTRSLKSVLSRKPSTSVSHNVFLGVQYITGPFKNVIFLGIDFFYNCVLPFAMLVYGIQRFQVSIQFSYHHINPCFLGVRVFFYLSV